jgi:hypothetical protein
MKREMNRILKECWSLIGQLWHREMRPKHFTHAGAREYGYTPRSGESARPCSKGFRRSYTGRKLRKFGHTLPLVYTGTSRGLTRTGNITATSKGVRIAMHAPALNLRPKGGTINLYDEMTRISQREKGWIERNFHSLVESKLKGITATETVRAA